MATTADATGEPRQARAPPPTPIATGKGTRSAAVDDRVLAEFLETIKVPELTLPDPVFPARIGPRVPAEVDLPSLIARDGASVRRMLASAAVVGAFRVDGKGVVPAEEVRSVVEAGRAGFRVPEAKRREMVACFGRREGVGEELYWDWRRSSETESVLEKVWPGTYRTFSEKMESLASKLEMVAQCLQRIISRHLKDQSQSRGGRRVRSILCLRKYDPNYSGGDSTGPVDAKHLQFPALILDPNYSGGDSTGPVDAKHLQFPALILHLYGDDHKFSIRCPEGSLSSGVSTASILVTVDEQIQEWCNDAFKSPSEEAFYESSCVSIFSRNLETISSPIAPSCKEQDTIKVITLTDQLFILLVLSFLYKLCACIFFKFI